MVVSRTQEKLNPWAEIVPEKNRQLRAEIKSSLGNLMVNMCKNLSVP
jgi:hypothetical protein